MPKRKHFSTSQKAQITLEVLKEEKTVNQIASEYGVHPNFVSSLLPNLPAKREAVLSFGTRDTIGSDPGRFERPV